jgi:hypothetical protein
MLNPWLALTFQAARLTWEAQSVMALRLMKLSGGGSAAHSEARAMFTEKVAALSEALAVATSATLGGSNGARTAKRVLNVYRSRVRSNQRRLSR